MLFVFGFCVLALQPWMPLNPDGKGMLAPTTIFHSVVSFMTNTDLQHYSGDQHLLQFQPDLLLPHQFLPVGVDRLLRADRDHPRFPRRSHVGNFFVDMWRVVVYMFLPVAFILGIDFRAAGQPDDLPELLSRLRRLEPAAMGTTDKGDAKPQTIVVGPLAAFDPMKQLGTNGGGFYGMNSAHPFENPTALTNFFNALAMMLFPFALVLMYGRMLERLGMPG